MGETPMPRIEAGVVGTCGMALRAMDWFCAGKRHSERGEESALSLTRRKMKQILRCAQDDVVETLMPHVKAGFVT